MRLDDLFMPPIAGGVRGRIIAAEMPEGPQPLTPAQIEQRRAARAKQIGQPKAANRMKR